jgi:hypothetical protein
MFKLHRSTAMDLLGDSAVLSWAIDDVVIQLSLQQIAWQDIFLFHFYISC